MKHKKSVGGLWQTIQSKVHYFAIALLVLGVAVLANAQTATVQGNLSNMDVINQTGQDTHGFEIEIEGAIQNDLYYTGYGQRYGAGVVSSYATGVRIRWSSSYDSVSHQYSKSTPQYTPGTPVSWNDCYIGGSRYSVSGCENFGQGMRNISTITVIKGYWLVDDPTNPGSLIRYNPNVAIPLPGWFFPPPPPPGTPPVVVAEVEAPEAPELPELFGDAQWLKIYTTQVPRALSEADLQTGGGTVPQDPAQVEVSWDIIQAQPVSGGNGNGRQNRSRKQNQTIIATATRSIIRRYETYKFTGAYDAITHEALCADLTCTAPAASELGNQIGGANSAVNVTPDSVVITKTGTGGGNIDSADKFIACGSKCGSTYNAGTIVKLTAKANSGSTFAGWTGACSGTNGSCSVTATGAIGVGAIFTANPTGGGGGGGTSTSFTLQTDKGGTGTVTSNVGTINCGSICSNSYAVGTTVTITATPAAGWNFVNWTGDCAGTSTTCTLTMTANKRPKANFVRQ
jgi:hypothetical protein